MNMKSYLFIAISIADLYKNLQLSFSFMFTESVIKNKEVGSQQTIHKLNKGIKILISPHPSIQWETHS